MRLEKLGTSLIFLELKYCWLVLLYIGFVMSLLLKEDPNADNAKTGNKKMKKIVIVLFLSFFAWSAIADDQQMQSEIDHLIKYIQNSSCKFIRNGKAHRPEAALEHILKKYDHFKAKIKTTEAFIDFCATKSLLSNQSYQISCPEQEWVESRYWLRKELNKFRNQ